MDEKKKIKVRVVPRQEIPISITTDFIRLDAFLKLCNAVESGGHAKEVIQAGEVLVNGEVCLQRGRKLRGNDRAQFGRDIFVVVYDNIGT